MMEIRETLWFRLWFLVVALLVAVNLALVSFNLSTTDAVGVNPTVAYDRLAGKPRLDGLKNFAHGAVESAISVARVPTKIVGVISKPGSLVSIIKPASADKTPVPVIGVSGEATVNRPSASTQDKPQWPIHGHITTYFGVPEWPFERVHTGLDISDGHGAGTTPIKPFLPGVVVAVVPGGGLGNHVIIDHGGGLTSVYGHLSYITVRSGERVSQNTTLGYEGSTGVSTGTHLHFEIRVNGQPQNPLQFIKGRP